MASKAKCIQCGEKRDRGPYTKLCASCFYSECPRCGETNERGPYTSVCLPCSKLPPLPAKDGCSRCGRERDRGKGTRVCSVCVEYDTPRVRKLRMKTMNLESRLGMKWCPTCELYKGYSSFYTTSRTSGDSCIECSPSTPGSGRLKSKFNLTDQDYKDIFEFQGRVCAICGNKPQKKKFHVDHDHNTGLIRGILCLWCNHKVLGGARDDIDILKKAVSYLENPPAVQAIGEVFGQTGSINKKNPNNKELL